MTWKEQDAADRQRYQQQRWAGGSGPTATGAWESGGAPSGSKEDLSALTLYAQLGVPPSASCAELRRAWIQLVVAAHPDKGGSPERFQALQRAYRILSDPAQRAVYDGRLALASSRSHAGEAAAAAAGSSRGGIHGRPRVVKSSGGVTAVVHGQTGPAERPLKASAEEAGAAAAGQHGAGSVADLTAHIEALRLEQQQKGGSNVAAPACNSSSKSSASSVGPPAAAGGAEVQGCCQQQPQLALAELFLQRAQAHCQEGRLHHAVFDAQEAASLCPGWEPAKALAQELDAALLGAEGAVGAAEAVGAAGAECDSSSDSDDGFINS